MIRYISYFLGSLLLVACRQDFRSVKLVQKSAVSDSFIIVYKSRAEISQMLPVSDSVYYSFNRDGYSSSRYEKSGDGIIRQSKELIQYNAPEPLLAFFLDAAGQPNFISDSNVWLKVDTQGNFYVYDTIRLGLRYLQEHFRIFSNRDRPLLQIDGRLFFSPVWVELEDYDTYLKEPCLVSIPLNRKNTTVHQEYFAKPAFFKEYPNPHISYCFNGKEIVLLYPHRDTVYIYDLTTARYRKQAIYNTSYVQPELVDTKQQWENVYTTRYKLHNFEYESIWYNKNTGHYVLRYSLPVDQSIKTPTYNDQPNYAIVLNERFETLQNLCFPERYYSSNVLQTKQGLAMAVYSKHQRQLDHDIPIKYYVYNF